MIIKLYSILFLSSVFFLKPFWTEDTDKYIFYTSNINGSWEDCGCYGIKIGGLARVKTVVDLYRSKYKNVYLIDAGDSFTSFDYPEKNRAILSLMREMNYDFIPQADQEILNKKIPHSYFDRQHQLFDFYIPEESFQDQIELLKFFPGNYKPGKSPFLIFHGDSSSFRKHASKFPDKKYIFLSHSQEMVNVRKENKQLLQSGYDLEYLGLLHVDKNYNLIENKFIRLDTTIVEDIEVRKKIEFFYESQKPKSKEIKKQQVYKSIDNCKLCHEEEYKSWKETNHAHAFQTLKEVNRAFDESCLKCHTTAFKNGGFTSYERSEQFINVQCESCHTNLGDNHQLAENRLKRHKVNEKACLTCHTNENSPKFNYAIYMEKIKHWEDE